MSRTGFTSRQRSWLLAPGPLAMALSVAFFASGGTWLHGAPQDEQAAPKERATAEEGSSGELSRAQEQLAEKYQRFEEVLVRMAELTAPTDPKRAALLRKAVAESKHQLIGVQLEKLVDLLSQDRLSVALTNQNDVNKDLNELLELLLTEERGKALQDERQRIKEQIRKVNELINKERQLQGQTSGGGEMQQIAKGQAKVADEAGKLAEEMKPAEGRDGKEPKEGDEQDSRDGKPASDRKPGDGGSDQKPNGGKESSEGKAKEGEAKEGESPGKESEGSGKEGKDGKKKDGEKSEDKKSGDSDKPDGQKESKDDKSGDKKPDDSKSDSSGDSSPPSEGQQEQGGKGKPQKSEGQPQQGGGQGEPEESDQQQDQNQQQSQNDSARKRVAAAQEKMQQARLKLEKAQREGAVEDQEAAIRELEQAKAELEEILRQLREEELERMLAMLESRFRKMLQAQVEVYEGTKRVDHTPAAERDRDDEIEAGRLSRKESQIMLEADSALALLREEGSAVAFPEAVEQMREDMDQVVVRLGQADVGDMTQSIEEDIIAALEEMIESLQKAQQDLEKQKQQQQQQEGQSQDPPLIDNLAELKMIRSLQMRINMRTKRLARLVEGEIGQADKPELLEQLQRLAEREESVFRVTRDIVTGKNR